MIVVPLLLSRWKPRGLHNAILHLCVRSYPYPPPLPAHCGLVKGAFKMACHNLTCLPLITMSSPQPLNQLSTGGTDSALDGRTPRQSVILVGTVAFHLTTGLRLCHSNHLPLHSSTLSAKASKNRPTYGHPGTFLSPRAVQVLIRQLAVLLDFDTWA